MAYLNYPGLAYFKSLLDQTYLRVGYNGDTVIAGNVTFTNPITGDINGKAKKDWLGQQFDTTYLKDIQPDESGALKLILGNGQVSHLVTDTTVTQERSSANETYPVLLCYDENATANQIAKKVKYGHDVQINPAYGYIYAQGYVEKHPVYNRTAAQSSRAEWMLDFRDSVFNPVGQIYSYIDPSSQGGEHRMEFRLYGNPHTTSLNLPNYNFETDTVSLGVSSTKGDKLTFFGYAPSTPIYLENGSTMRKSTVRGDQYGRDIITRDWLNLNGSITGLVHTYMDETIDGYKTFLKTVTIDSGNDNAKAGLNVQGDVNIDSGDASKPSNLYVQGNSHIHGNEDIDGNLNVDGTSTLDGNVHMKHNLDVDGNLNVDGTSDQHGNVHMYNNLDVDGNANTDGNQTIGGTLTVTGNETVGGTLTVTGKITGNGGAEISGGNGLKVTGNETVTGNLTVGGTTTTEDLTVNDDATVGDDLIVNGDTNVAGTINKKTNNTTQEYVTYITNQVDTRKNIAQNLVDTSRGVGYDASTGKIYAKIDTTQGLKFNSSGAMSVDFSDMPTDKFEALLKALKMQIPLTSNIELHVDINSDGNSIVDGRGTAAKPFKSINSCVTWAVGNYALGAYNITILVHPGTYEEQVNLTTYNAGRGSFIIKAYNPAQPPVISRNNVVTGSCISITGGYWKLERLTLSFHPVETSESRNYYPYCLSVGDGAECIVYGCNFIMKYNGSTTEKVRMFVVSAASGIIQFMPYATYKTTFDYHLGNGKYLHVIEAETGGKIYFRGTFDDSLVTQMDCQGDCTSFCNVSSQSLAMEAGSGDRFMYFAVASGKTCTGTQYIVDSNSGVLSPDGGFPGDPTNNTVDASTYCWYKS